MEDAPYDVIIIGGGVTGTATLYILARYTNIKRIALIDKYLKVAQVNSHRNNNSQTLHFGDIETNYTAEKARKVKASSSLTVRYLERYRNEKLFRKTPKMVLAVGNREVEELAQRYDEIKEIFPNLKKIGRREISKFEPKVVECRDPKEKILALYSPDGYAVDYGKLSESFVRHAKEEKTLIDMFFGMKVWNIRKEGKLYRIINGSKKLRAKAVIVASGADSLLFAHKMDYAKHWILLPVAGSFYCAKKMLNGKVYTMQVKKLPFAAVHGDPDVVNSDETRFGPTAKVLPMLERHHYASILDFLRLFRFRFDALASLFKILSDPVLFKYVLCNVVYDLPVIGTYFFMKQNVRKIIPSVTYSQIHFGRGLGGIRPQLVDTTKRSLEFGDAKIIGDNIIFDITPSPGASVCLNNAKQNARKAMEFLNGKFNEKLFAYELQQ